MFRSGYYTWNIHNSSTRLHASEYLPMHPVNPLSGNGPYFIILLCLTPPDYFTMSNARRFYSSVGRMMPLNGLMVLDDMVLNLK